jgi:hypothetical protein
VLYACVKIDVMKKECKNLEFRREVNMALVSPEPLGMCQWSGDDGDSGI